MRTTGWPPDVSEFIVNQKVEIVTPFDFAPEWKPGAEFKAALPIVNGIPNSPLNRYFQVKNAVVAFNTFVNCKYTFVFGFLGRVVTLQASVADGALKLGGRTFAAAGVDPALDLPSPDDAGTLMAEAFDEVIEDGDYLKATCCGSGVRYYSGIFGSDMAQCQSCGASMLREG